MAQVAGSLHEKSATESTQRAEGRVRLMRSFESKVSWCLAGIFATGLGQLYVTLSRFLYASHLKYATL